MDLNTCYETTNYYHTIAFYSHLVPVALALFLSIYTLFKTKHSSISIAFFAFTTAFSVWLLNDLVLWTSKSYSYIYYFWSWIDYMDVLFFVLGSYFYTLLVQGKVENWKKILLIVVCIPAFIFAATGNNVTGFDQTVCEAVNNVYEVYYKTFVEWFSIVVMVLTLMSNWKKIERSKKKAAVVVMISILLFFAIFSLTEYLAAFTEIYEINLYGLFVLPLFLIIMVFSVTNLGLFQFRLLGTQILGYVLVILVGSQLLFIEGSVYRNLTILTLVATLLIVYLLLQNSNKELKQRNEIEKLAGELKIANDKLKELDQMKSEFLSLATHQIRSPLTSIKGYASLLLDGDYGSLDEKAKEGVKIIFNSCDNLVKIVGDFLNISRIEQGRMAYNKEVFDLALLSKETANEYKPNIDKAKLALTLNIPETVLNVNADKVKTKEIVGNLIDNAIKYTKQGSIQVIVGEEGGKIKVSVKDTGIGIEQSEIYKLFNKFSRTKDAHKTNVTGTGLGLYIAKQMAVAQGGDIEVFSEGENKGTTFTLKLPKAS